MVEPYALAQETIGEYLVGRGVLPHGEAQVRALPGGVSSDVLVVSAGGTSVVVKQALPRLRVAQEWLADRSRIEAEAAALRLARSLRPDGVPEVIDMVGSDYLLVMEMAPPALVSWKGQLLAGQVDERVARRVGELTGTWHAKTMDDPVARERFGDKRALVELRVDPFYRTVARLHPELARRIEALASALLETSRCLVHGDLSPKNVLSDGERTWVIDWEVATFGAPVFDLAFMICHLRCKAEARPVDAPRYRMCAQGFLDGYQSVAGALFGGIDESELAAQAACLLLARADGKSPVEYLGPEAHEAIRRLACDLLSEDRLELDQIWED